MPDAPYSRNDVVSLSDRSPIGIRRPVDSDVSSAVADEVRRLREELRLLREEMQRI